MTDCRSLEISRLAAATRLAPCCRLVASRVSGHRALTLAAITVVHLLTWSAISPAEEMNVLGMPGTNGAIGVDGAPGGDGGAGESVVAIADAQGEDNIATAEGGPGGRGGSGGDALPGSGAAGGDGGDAGRGGDATAEAITIGADEATATAIAGNGGFIGSGGAGDPPESGMEGAAGQGGAGGAAVATGHIETALNPINFQRVEGRVIARGGRGSGVGNNGGDATARLTAEFTGGDDPIVAFQTLSAIAEGGRARLDETTDLTRAGDAHAEVEATTSLGLLVIDAMATGGSGSSFSPIAIPLGEPGDATALAHGTMEGPGELRVRAHARPGSSRTSSGVGLAEASGITNGGGNVRVEALVDRGRDIVMRNAVSGSTSGRLTLLQTAEAISTRFASRPGSDAHSFLDATNPGGGELAIEVTARASDAVVEGDGGDAIAEAVGRGVGSALVTVRTQAFGGSPSGLTRPSWGRAGDATAHAIAEGLGEVRATAQARGGATATQAHPLLLLPTGSAHARAEASGASGLATADASTGVGRHGDVVAQVFREVRGATIVEAFASDDTVLPSLPVDAIGAAAIAGPLAGDALVDGVNVEGALEAALDASPTAHARAAGRWNAKGADTGVVQQTTELEITLRTPSSGADLLLAVFDVQATGGGFETLSFNVDVNGTPAIEGQTFGELDAALAFFAAPFDLGTAYVDSDPNFEPPAVRIVFEAMVGAGQSIEMGVAAVVVPEPSTALLVGLGLVWIARRTRARLQVRSAIEASRRI